MSRINQELFDLRKHPNILALNLGSIMENGKSFHYASQCVTPHNESRLKTIHVLKPENYETYPFFYHLREKLENKIPKLHKTQRKWLAFQLLCAIS
jgi:hypothetical protein